MIAELLDLADRLEIPTPRPFECLPLHYFIDLDGDGKLLGISPAYGSTKDKSGEPELGKLMDCPVYFPLTLGSKGDIQASGGGGKSVAEAGHGDTKEVFCTDIKTPKGKPPKLEIMEPAASNELEAIDAETDPDEIEEAEDDSDAVIQTLIEAPDLKERAIGIFKSYEVEGSKLTDEDWKKVNQKSKKQKKDDATEAEPEKKGAKKERNLSEYVDRAYRDALCEAYFDVRYFGAVVSTTGPLHGSYYGQIRGPLQITFAESLDKILQLDFSITRCAVANEAEAEKKGDDNRTMGRKHTVPYGLYRCHIHFSPAFAAKTGFTYADLDNFLFALTRCLGDYNVDGSSARPGGMRVVGLVDFQHKDALGNAPAHKVFDLVRVEGKKNADGRFDSDSEFPHGLQDYTGSAPDGPIYVEKNRYEQVVACSTVKPPPKDGNEAVSPIAARRLIWGWEIPDAT